MPRGLFYRIAVGINKCDGAVVEFANAGFDFFEVAANDEVGPDGAAGGQEREGDQGAAACHSDFLPWEKW